MSGLPPRAAAPPGRDWPRVQVHPGAGVVDRRRRHPARRPGAAGVRRRTGPRAARAVPPPGTHRSARLPRAAGAARPALRRGDARLRAAGPHRALAAGPRPRSGAASSSTGARRARGCPGTGGAWPSTSSRTAHGTTSRSRRTGEPARLERGPADVLSLDLETGDGARAPGSPCTACRPGAPSHSRPPRGRRRRPTHCGRLCGSGASCSGNAPPAFRAGGPAPGRRAAPAGRGCGR